MPHNIITTDNVPIKLWTHGVPIEPQALNQLRNIASLPFIHSHIAVMPDAHWGIGATVGSVIPTIGAIIPAAVGVDIGCGMVAQRLTLTANDLPNNLHEMRSAIEAAVPHGRTNKGRAGDRGAWHNVPPTTQNIFVENFHPRLQKITARHPKLERVSHRAPHHLGTLGGGNHFVEVCLDEKNRVWVMLHSGSRGIGNAIGNYFIERAKEHMYQQQTTLPNEDLAYLPEKTQDFDDYVEAVGWAQDFAAQNRRLMLHATITAVLRSFSKETMSAYITAEAINCHHNYVARENHYNRDVFITRKGAISASSGELGIIPGSMGTRSYIVRGRGNPESFSSCSHGAGRIMSRSEAKRRFTVEDHELATLSIECRKDAGVIDETPGAYKDIDAVMAAQEDLVEIVHELRQVICVKG